MAQKQPELSLDFVICVEKGYYEKQAMLLVATIRAFGGAYKDAPIFCYAPRRGFRPSQETIQFLQDHDVCYSDRELNKEFKYYHFANKPAICAYHEKNSQASRIFYLDCDSLLMRDPSDLLDFGDNQLVARPEDAKGFATSVTFNDENAPQWKKLFSHFGITDYPTVWTVMDNKEVVSYYNAGQIICSRTTGVFTLWNELFRTAQVKKLFEKEYFVMSEQMMFSIAIAKSAMKAVGEGQGFNFPLNLHAFDTILNPLYCNETLEDQVTLHYHKIFLRGENPVSDELNRFETGARVNKMLVDFDMFTYQNSLKDKVRSRLYAALSRLKYTK
jgi:hypothetical protein